MVKIFAYLEELDCFVTDPAYRKIAGLLGIAEWHAAVWIGRFFCMDNNFGGHWLDNHRLQDSLTAKAAELGFSAGELLVINPDYFKNGDNGPCHTAAERLAFWRDVLLSLHLSYETLFTEARKFNAERKHHNAADFIPDLEERIRRIAQESCKPAEGTC